jgi:DNA-binding LacI/PurR family transcriptional regulator
VAGAVIIAPELLGDLPAELLTASVPIVATGGVKAVTDIGRGVVIDTRNAVRSAAEELLERGARSLALIAGPADNSTSALQVDGFRDAVGDCGPERILHGDYTAESGEETALGLLSGVLDVDGLVVASDVMASGALRAAATCGRSVPASLRIIGFDDSPVAQLTSPALSTVHVPFTEIGAELATLLVEALQDLPPRITTLPTSVIRREST